MATHLTLHDAISEVLMAAGVPLSARTIADEVNRLGRYTRRDGAPVDANQITSRTHNYPHLFTVVDGLIAQNSPSRATRTKGRSIVRDYRALGQYFRGLNVDVVTLHFTEIEEILNAPLPPVARRSDTFWQNSDPFLPKPDGHKWAHAWMKAGWQKRSVNRQAEIAVFERGGGPTPLSTLDELRPDRLELIYDILERVPIAIDEWHMNANCRAVKNFKANPRFCYNWSFGSREEGYAVCLWHENLKESAGGDVFSDTNYRAGAQERRARAGVLAASNRERLRLIGQADRGMALDRAVCDAFHLGQPLHVIICARGEQVDGATMEFPMGTSSVKARELDSVTWSVESYDDATGACHIVRGPARATAVGTIGEAARSDEWIAQYIARLIRPEQAAFRRAVLDAYDGRCAISGCDIQEALEAAHLHGRDWRAGHNDATDGILLRRDLHALYDRGLLDVVEGVARFSSDVFRHYENLEGQPVAVCRVTGRDGAE
ncbi:HNH endonuclease [Burkholderia cenocepacia]|uniref:HNH endonuclease n=1 Tax=Burkholderia cenocepacia TaxID=95486 RepID=UPI0022EA356E|nr:HNH endonuclease signature motif containing protein [Burkholderia cenocepacia]MDA3669883.1 HNH endonuclease signature motif containing protein [Burkholderia cenocepacia]MDA3679864.1 HNH endonuclease signature motif containing protein [Burkholderia cenocepacia]MDA3687699.1 HNH endonuclease signature motif containing protein [Burkholderia cenocepacia]MDA3694897.1 HNH endonuclease signature motif containing protein [Burkholderia cenocepacia]MDA3702047.1 HNH endonuclease signature motif contain